MHATMIDEAPVTSTSAALREPSIADTDSASKARSGIIISGQAVRIRPEISALTGAR
jgi:hypothetical protein